MDVKHAKILIYGSAGKIIDLENYLWCQSLAGVSADEAERAYTHIRGVSEGTITEDTAPKKKTDIEALLQSLLASGTGSGAGARAARDDTPVVVAEKPAEKPAAPGHLHQPHQSLVLARNKVARELSVPAHVQARPEMTQITFLSFLCLFFIEILLFLRFS
jgi:hypothetical protein